MARRIRSYHRNSSWKFRSTPYPLPSYQRPISAEGSSKKTSFTLERKDWKGATCPVCMEFPHNAVLLLCSSHDKGCRPYMCATSCRFSNCLEQFKKAYAKTTSLVESRIHDLPAWKKCEVVELACPLCRGQVKGWTVVEPARKYLNKKRRSCMQDDCSFIGSYKELRKHMRSEHPCAKPHVVDPVLEQKWRNLEYQSERADVISTIRSSMPRSVILGDYVIDMDDSDYDTDFDDDGDSGTDFDDYNDDFFDNANGIFGRRNGRSIFTALMREAARHRRFRRSRAGNVREGSNSHLPTVVDRAARDAAFSFRLEEHDDDDGSAVGITRSERQRRRGLGRSSVHGTRLL
ncbi:hypothetical protein MUK42_15398 [Musa troglodytarum]|uniref:Uncharacterized protein n=1 Tax=Musa troglodytarum TaxID=320322 RepID=A0A9E7IEE7_9LILI|nr:hypothetical protein MUK42_15398 [Musa troglodytarum]URE47743.1 hypothetical protein MUK42_15398 [Musa troglodytarum]